MKKVMRIYESVKLPVRIAFFGFILIGFGFLIQNESVNIFYTFSNSLLLMFAQGCLMLGKTIIINLPLIFMIYIVCKKANSGVPIVLALLGYFAYLITTALFSSQSLSTYAYASGLGINAIVDISGLTKYPLETGLIGSFIVGYITRFSFINNNNLVYSKKSCTFAAVFKRFTPRYEENSIVYSAFAWSGHTSFSPRHERHPSPELHTARTESRYQPVSDRDAPDAAWCHIPAASACSQEVGRVWRYVRCRFFWFSL